MRQKLREHATLFQGPESVRLQVNLCAEGITERPTSSTRGQARNRDSAGNKAGTRARRRRELEVDSQTMPHVSLAMACSLHPVDRAFRSKQANDRTVRAHEGRFLRLEATDPDSGSGERNLCPTDVALNGVVFLLRLGRQQRQAFRARVSQTSPQNAACMGFASILSRLLSITKYSAAGMKHCAD
jgi:hypothetical protein